MTAGLRSTRRDAYVSSAHALGALLCGWTPSDVQRSPSQRREAVTRRHRRPATRVRSLGRVGRPAARRGAGPDGESGSGTRGPHSGS